MERIQLSNATFEGDNNVYLFDGDETVLVDTGDWMAGTREQLVTALEARNLGFADIDRLFLTHWHGDHVGLAGDIQAESGATVHVHEKDVPLVSGDVDAWSRLDELHERRFEQWGIPEYGREVLRRIFTDTQTHENPPDVTPIQDGDTFTVDGQRFEAVHAPGHAAGLCMYAFGDEVLTGDALLPQYTPNVGGADVRVDQPLALYLETLRDIVAAGYDRAWPGHRDVIEEPAVRAEEIIAHHRERAWRVLDTLRRLGPADPWTVSADLFGNLEGIHILHGPGEAYAHLTHLEQTGDVRREGDSYRLADGVAERVESADRVWPLS